MYFVYSRRLYTLKLKAYRIVTELKFPNTVPFNSLSFVLVRPYRVDLFSALQRVVGTE